MNPQRHQICSNSGVSAPSLATDTVSSRALTEAPRTVHPILVVDDEATIRDAIQSLLEMEGYAVTVAHDGEDALQQLRAGLDPALILLDVDMPVKDGFQFRREQLAIPELAAIPTIIWSAQSAVQETAHSLDGVLMLHKGTDVDTLLACIEARRRHG